MDKINAIFLLFLVTGTIPIIEGCHEKEDTQYPEISVIQPLPGSIYENGDTIKFKAVFSDNQNLKNVEISLVDPDNKPMLATLSQIPGQNPFTHQGDYVIDDPFLPGGIYQLRFRATDGLNVTNKFIEIQIHELAKKLLYPIVVTHPEPGKWKAYRLTNNDEWKEFYIQSGDYIGSAVNSPASQFYMCGITISHLVAIKLPDGAPLWNVKPGIHLSQRWFEGIEFSYPQLYVTCAEGNIRGFDKTGSEIYKSDTYAAAVPHLAVTTKNFIIASFKDAFSNNRFLIAFHNPGGLMINQKFIQSDVTALLQTTADKVLVFSNSDGLGNISLYNGADNTLIPMHPFYKGTFKEAKCLDSDNYLIASSAGLYRYQLSNNSLTPFVMKLINSQIACDNTSGLIYTCSGKMLEVYTFPFASLVASYSLPDTAIDLHLLFNK